MRIAHDFNNLLMAILGHCDLLERGAEGSNDAVTEIRTAAETAAGLTRELMAVAARPRPGSTHGNAGTTPAVGSAPEGRLSGTAGP